MGRGSRGSPGRTLSGVGGPCLDIRTTTAIDESWGLVAGSRLSRASATVSHTYGGEIQHPIPAREMQKGGTGARYQTLFLSQIVYSISQERDQGH